MNYWDYGHEEAWNMDMTPGRGDSDYTLYRTRSFTLCNQCDYGPIFDLHPAYWRDSLVLRLMHDEPHWSDPVYYPA